MKTALHRFLLALRTVLSEGPSYAFHFLFSKLYSASVLRMKAAATPYPSVRKLLLARSGLAIGKDVFVHMGVLVIGRSRNPPSVTFGDRSAMGPNCVFVASTGPEASILHRHPELQNAIVEVGPITVEPDAWIGAGAIIFPNVTIGRGAVVGSGAVVTRDVPPFTIVTGIPARPMRTLTPPEGLTAAGSEDVSLAIRDRRPAAQAS